MSRFCICIFIALFFELSVCYCQEKKEGVDDKAERSIRMSILVSSTSSTGPYSPVSEELEITSEQKEELHRMVREHMAEMRRSHFRMKSVLMVDDGSKSERDKQNAREECEREVSDLAAKFETELSQILLPHQTKRLKEIAYQRMVCMANNVEGVFVLIPVVESLDSISAEEKKRLLKATRDAMGRFEDDVSKLRKKYEAEIMAELPKDAIDVVNEKIGDIVYEKAR